MCGQGLDPNVILEHEFDYAAQTAFQAHEDRGRVFSYYLAAAATVVGATVFVDMAERMHLVVLGTVLCGLALLGFLTLLQQAKLRLAWRDSVLTMCRIKDHYITACDGAELDQAFRWKTETVPPAGKKGTVAYLLAVALALLNAALLGGALVLFGSASVGGPWVAVAVPAAVVAFIAQLAVWSRMLRQK